MLTPLGTHINEEPGTGGVYKSLTNSAASFLRQGSPAKYPDELVPTEDTMSTTETITAAEPKTEAEAAPIRVMIISPRNLAAMEDVMEEMEKLYGPPQS